MESKDVNGEKTTKSKANGSSKVTAAAQAATNDSSTPPAGEVAAKSPAAAAKAPAVAKAKPGKASAKPRSTTPAASKKPAARSMKRPPLDEIQLRAYFIAERRHREGQGGDPAQDWFHAEQELLAEARKKPGKA